jgi:hypothetical protein
LAEAFPVLMRQLPQHKPWMVALSLIAVVVVIGTCGLGSYMLVKGGNTVIGAEGIPTPTAARRDISNRTADPAQLTTQDVFPNKEITADPSVPPYKRIGDPQAAADCRVAASADVGKFLVTLGCNQVVRATYSSTEGSYLVTAGIFNLVDNASAAKANTDIKALVDGSKGRFSGYVSGTDAKMLGRSATQLSWAAEGHFLMFTVIARADGKDFSDADAPHVKVIVYDILSKHLRDGVLGEWSIDRSTAAPGASGASQSAPVG